MIGIDIGTTSTKAVAFTEKGEVLAVAGCSYSAITDPDGRHELDPDLLLDAVISVLKEVGAKTAGAGQTGLAGISFSCAMHSLIAVDARGEPLTRAMTWADLRSKPYAAALKGSEAGRRIYRQTGTPIHPMSPLSKLLWLKEKEPALFARAAKFISIKEYIWWRFFGKYQVDHSIASATGLFDIYVADWYPASLELAGIGAERLSAPVPCTHIESVCKYGQALGLPGNLPFIIGGSDGCLANLGSGAVLPGETALTIGTSGAIRMTAGAPRYDPGERIFNYILTDKFYVSGGATNNGGGVLQWYLDHFPGKGSVVAGDINGLVSLSSTAPAGAEGLLFLPYLQGERAPIWNADAKAVFFGIRPVHGQSHFIRAVLEGISYSLCQVGAVLEETIGPVQHIVASGGFTRSAFWLQMIADIFSKKVYTTSAADASAIGAAMLGFYALGIIPDLKGCAALIKVRDEYQPDAERHGIYRQQYQLFGALYERIKDLM